MKVNKNYLQLKESYLFSTISKKVAAFSKENPNASIIRLGIGDVTLPLVPAVVDALKAASEEMGVKETFHGYGPEQGYDFLKGRNSRVLRAKRCVSPVGGNIRF